MLDQYGTLTLAEALQPAIDLAESGFPVSPIIARQWAAELDLLQEHDGAAATYLVDGNRTPRAGEWFRNPDFAHTLRLIAEQGSGVLYGGELGQSLMEALDELRDLCELIDQD